jgi:hypothetical protein
MAIQIQNIVLLLYGQPGVGKSSMAFTAAGVLLLDTDSGAHRSAFRKDIVPVDSWQDIQNITADDLADYHTVAVDTVGRVLDMLALHIIATNPKMGYQGALAQQGFGQLKIQFKAWVDNLRSLGKDVVLIAHEREERRGDDTVVRPDIQGSSAGEVYKIADSVGYISFASMPKRPGFTEHSIDFNPSTKSEGKNVAGFPVMQIPDFNEKPEFLAELISAIKGKVNELSAEGKMIADIVAKQREGIDAADGPTMLNKCLEAYRGLMKPAQAPVKRLIMKRSIALGCAFDKDRDCFTGKDPEPVVDAKKEPETGPGSGVINGGHQPDPAQTGTPAQASQDAAGGTAASADAKPGRKAPRGRDAARAAAGGADTP